MNLSLHQQLNNNKGWSAPKRNYIMRFEYATDCDTTLNQSQPNLTIWALIVCFKQKRRHCHWDQSPPDHFLPFELFHVTNSWLSYGFTYTNFPTINFVNSTSSCLNCAGNPTSSTTVCYKIDTEIVRKHNLTPLLICSNFQGQFGEPCASVDSWENYGLLKETVWVTWTG